ncbi:MAG: hypothetical protein RMI91_12370 [Gemmatales bacterium]|nr:hypothetical protein [Gemmatales bacterium]MDW7995436.1 hypothetical protein [Gemmatales bacterium]
MPSAAVLALHRCDRNLRDLLGGPQQMKTRGDAVLRGDYAYTPDLVGAPSGSRYWYTRSRPSV